MRHSAIRSAILFGLSVVGTNAHADTDVQSLLNAKLASKNIIVKKSREVDVERHECHFEGPNGRPHRECNSWTERTTQVYPDQARVAGLQVLTVAPVKWDEAKLTALPATALIQRLTYENCGQDAFSTGYTLSVKGVRSNSVSKTHSVSVKTGIGLKNTFKAGNGLFGGETSIDVSLDVTTSDSTTTSEQTSNEETRTWPTTISVAPGHAGYLQLLAIQQSIEVPFATTIVVDADMEPNISGITKVSQLLSEEERTVPFDGSVKASQLSDSFAGNFKPDVPFSCDDPGSKGKMVGPTVVNYSVPLSALDSKEAKQFDTVAAVYEAMQNKNAAHTVAVSDERIQPQSVFATEVLEADARCGFGPDGQAKLAIYKADLTHYFSMDSGKVQKQFDEFYDQFEKCR